MSSEPRSRRRWLQFSIRSMFVLALVVAAFCAGLTYQRGVQERLRAEIKQAKAEIEIANRRVAIERLRGEMARVEAERRALQAQIEATRSRWQASQEVIKAKLIEIRSLRREIKETEAALRKARNRYYSDGMPAIPGDDFPMPKPSPPSSFEFDQPLLDRTIG
jgi:septal ring factor EnvC (AmiA/AmiB activator)